jgi:hypothetical protein
MDAKSLKFPHGLLRVSSEIADVGGVACNPSPTTGLNAQTERSVRGSVVPISIGFLRQFAAMPVTGPARKVTVAARFHHRMVLLTFAAWLTRRFRFALDRHNSATGLSPSSSERRPRRAADANHAGQGGRSWRKGGRAAAGGGLPKSWAKAGAFSLLTPASKLAQY